MSGVDDEYQRFDAHPKWYLGTRAALVVAFTIGLVAVLAIGDYGFSWWAAPWQGKLQARQQVQSGNYRIAAYTLFFDECASVQTLDNQIATQQRLLKQYPQTSTGYNETLTRISGLEGERADAINQYNADAAKAYTVGQFRASNLPYQLPNHSYQKGEQIQCAS